MIRPHPIVPVLVLGTTFAGTEARAQSQGINVLQNAPVATAQQAPGETASQSRRAPVALTADALQGPVTPVVMYAVAGLDDVQLAQYLVAYRAHMASTWNIRYAVMSSLRMMDRAVQNSDSDAARYYKVLTTELWQKVRAEDDGFDLALTTILHKGQLRHYRDWRAAGERGTQVQQRLEVALIQNGSG